MTPQSIKDKLREIEQNFVGSSNLPQAIQEETQLVLDFIKSLSERNVAFPSQASKVLYDGLRYLLKKQ